METKFATFTSLFFGLIFACIFGAFVMSLVGVDFAHIMAVIQHNVNPSPLQFGV